MEETQAVISEIDISDRLRSLMRERRISVAEMAKLAGVSKSTMEKYLAGPSSPRATAVASICNQLGVNAHWLIFGVPDEDLRIIRSAIEDVTINLLNELKQGAEVAEPFAKFEFGTKDWRLFIWELSEQRSFEAVQMIVAAREKALQDAREGIRTATAGPFPFRPRGANSNR